MAARQAESRVRPPHSPTAICLGISYFLRSGPIRRRRTRTATGPDPERKYCGLSRRTPTCFLRSTSKQRTSSREHLVRIYHAWPPSKRNTIPPISFARTTISTPGLKRPPESSLSARCSDDCLDRLQSLEDGRQFGVIKGARLRWLKLAILGETPRGYSPW
jgi:hypothetical protein